MGLSLPLGCRFLCPLQKTRASLPRTHRPLYSPAPPRRTVAVSVHSLSCKDIGSIVFSTVLSGLLILSPPSYAQVKTIPANEVGALAKPLPVEKVEKKRVWLVFVVGAASLFVFVNVIENNPSWFPSVARANRAMTARRKERISKVGTLELEEAEAEAARLTASVEQGLAEARKRRLEQETSIEDQNRTSEINNGQKDTDFILHKDASEQS